MTRLVFRVEEAKVSARERKSEIQVLLYGSHAPYSHVATVGAQAREESARMGVQPTPEAMDLLSVAMAVTAADTFVAREDAPDGWSRHFEIELPLCQPKLWESLEPTLTDALRFLSSDTWSFTFTKGGMRPPTLSELGRYRRVLDLTRADCTALFSGGLDSAIGALDLLEGGARPLLISHASRGDATKQEAVGARLPSVCQRLSVNTYPTWEGIDDDSMRTRSFQFLALGVLAASCMSQVRGGIIKLFVCENGLIALNPPLTPRRIGSHSTRTCHPYFLNGFRALVEALKLPVVIENPYEWRTKGEMVAAHRAHKGFRQLAAETVSCGKWKRKNQQCGRCVPCLIRRSALHAGGLIDDTNYQFPDLMAVMKDEDGRDDLIAIQAAIMRGGSFASWVSQSGPLPIEDAERNHYLDVARRGLNELADYLRSEGFRL
ncbi:Qat anti-phage system QueC-like protein QatC [Hyphomicrobium sp. DY-1]|uniref:Qat anti-phage system QueC-like protein QatC n=1 Tax=Hyphomicrobium sp. DY-1 TaxID=3075650 RepID=UPI0039C1CE4C